MFFRRKKQALDADLEHAKKVAEAAEAEHEKALEKLAAAEALASTVCRINARNHFSESLTKAFQKERPA
jgi:alkylhydroperoxidase family enzyme